MTPVNATPLKLLHDEKKEAARLGFSIRTLQLWRRNGGGPPFIKINSAVRYDPIAVDQWLNAHVRTNTAQGAA